MTDIITALNQAKQILKKNGIEDPLRDCEIILGQELKKCRVQLYIDKNKVLSKKILSSFRKKISKRASRVPLAYVTGNTNFMGFDFFVDKNVLVPRQETELLVEKVIEVLKPLQKKKVFILDIGTGCADIAVSIAKLLKNSKVYASDISSKALMVAKKNAVLNKVKNKITFLKGNLFEPCKKIKQKFDLIVSNPPYVPSNEIDRLQKELQFEPRIALDGGKDGLDFYRKLVNEAPLYLKKNGCLVFEIGIGQAKKIEQIIKEEKKFEKAQIFKDYGSIERIICVFLKKQKG